VGQITLGTIALKVGLDDLYTDALFHVIDANTSYNTLLGLPWLHTSKPIASSLHQCLKYTNYYGNVKIIHRDANPFHREDINYVDASFTNQRILKPPKFFQAKKRGIKKKIPKLLRCLKRSFRLPTGTPVKPRNINPYNQRCYLNTHPKINERLAKRP